MSEREHRAALRARAEAAFQASVALRPEVLAAPTPDATERLLHELRVREIELEMQHEELQRGRIELEAAQARYLALYDDAPAGYFTVSETGTVIEANLTLATLLGVARDGVVKQPFTRFIWNQDQDVFFLMKSQLFSSQANCAEPAAQSGLARLRLQRSDGTPVWVELLGKAAKGADAAPVLRIMVSESTASQNAEGAARTRDEEKLRSLNSHLQATLDAIPDPLFEVDSNGRVNGYRAHRADLLAAPPEVFLGKTLAEVLPPEATAVCMNALREASIEGWSAGGTYSLTLPRGETWFELSVAAMRDTGAAERSFIVLTRDITLRKAAEARVLASEARFRAAVGASPVPMALNDETGQITFLNAAFLRAFGYDLADIPTLDHWWPLAYPDFGYRQWVMAAWAMELARSTETGTPFAPLELTIRSKDGGERIALAYAAPLADAFSGTHLVVLHDITVSKQVDAALRRSRAEAVAARDQLLASQKANTDLSAALDAHAIVAMTDARGRITFVNDKFCAISQYSRDELLGQDHRIISSGRHSKEFIRDLWTTIRSGCVWQGELNNRAKDGTLYWVDTTIVPFVAADGRIRQYVAIRKDITARKHAEAQLQESEERFRQLAENIREVFWISDAAKKEIVYVSPAYEEIWGRSCADLYRDARAWLGAIHPEDRVRVQQAAETKQAHGLYAETYRIQRPDGTTRWIHDKAFPVLGPTGEVERIVGMAEDVTDRTQLEEQLRQAQKMEAIGTLAGGVAHDFNNLLATIIANLHVAESELEPQHPARDGLTQIGKAGRRAEKLIEGILSFSRMKPRELHALDLGPIVSEAAELLRATLPAGVSLVVRIDERLPRILGDATEVHQSVLNLGANAWQAMDGSPGEIRISVEAKVLGDSHTSRHPELQAGTYIRLIVEDSGKGMDQATIARIFDPFFTTKDVGAGTGLGLSVVHGIVKSMGGAIIVDSKLGRGSSFSVFIPQFEQATTSSPPTPRRPTVPRGKGQHLLLVEDEAGLLWATKRILERQGYRVTALGEASAALAALHADPSGFDLLITDQNMPGASGMEVVREARRLCPALPVVMTSGALAPAFVTEALASGVAHVLNKPFQPDALCALIYELVSGSSSVPPASRARESR